LYFSVSDWKLDSENKCEKIASLFRGDLVAVRSSALTEDTADNSKAGVFTSKLSIPTDNPSKIRAAVDDVIRSFEDNEPDNQVLIQKMAEDVVVSGVIFTYDIENGAPYYVISFDDESGRTDAVTSGSSTTHKMVLIHRNCDIIRPVIVRKLRAFVNRRRPRTPDSARGLIPVPMPAKLRFLKASPNSGTIRLTYTIPYVLNEQSSTLPDSAFMAVIYKASQLGCESLAAQYAKTSDPTIAADVVNYRTKSQEFSSLAERFRERYEAEVGRNRADGTIGEWDMPLVTGGPQLFHKPSWR